jgi:hypothetical protein
VFPNRDHSATAVLVLHERIAHEAENPRKAPDGLAGGKAGGVRLKLELFVLARKELKCIRLLVKAELQWRSALPGSSDRTANQQQLMTQP